MGEQLDAEDFVLCVLEQRCVRVSLNETGRFSQR